MASEARKKTQAWSNLTVDFVWKHYYRCGTKPGYCGLWSRITGVYCKGSKIIWKEPVKLLILCRFYTYLGSLARYLFIPRSHRQSPLSHVYTEYRRNKNEIYLSVYKQYIIFLYIKWLGRLVIKLFYFISIITVVSVLC